MIDYNLKNIRAVIFDVDGVLSASTVTLSPQGELLRTANVHDGYAMKTACQQGLHIAVITGGNTKGVKVRFESIGLKDIFMESGRKLDDYEVFLHRYHLKDEEVIFVGDDIPDIEVMKRCGCPCCPKDAVREVKDISLYVSDCKGGCGVGRDILEQVLRAQGKWPLTARAFG